MSDLTLDDAMESQFGIYNEENIYATGPKMVQKYRGGQTSNLMAIFYTNACLNITKLKTRTAATLYSDKYEKVMRFCKK